MNETTIEKKSNEKIRVLVTGAAGYLAIHCIEQLLKEGYTVRGTVRDANNLSKVQPLMDLIGAERLQLIDADLLDEDIWPIAVKGCDYVLHIASPCQTVVDDSVISTAVDGTLNVLRAAAKCDTVKKVVLTSSTGAINHGYKEPHKIFNEDDWTKLDGHYVHKYHVSKTMAERAAWDFIQNEPGVKFKLTVLNPGLIVGPLLQNNKGASAAVISRFLDSTMIAIPTFKCGIVDIDDTAAAHVRAMRNPESDNQRILVVASSMSFRQIAKILRKEFAPQGYYVPRLRAPFFLVRLYSLFDKETRELVRLGEHIEYFDNSKAQRILGINFKNPQRSLIEMCYDMIERGILPKKRKYRGRPQLQNS
uniref:Dihydroflavonol-4-reductase n=1 Tax=Ascaris suum TaxID=6253 RepID=F1L9G1_ASCSU